MPSPFKLVLVIVPHNNPTYAKRACRDAALAHGESPVCMAVAMAAFLDYNNPTERSRGLSLGNAWHSLSSVGAVVYTDYGNTPEMSAEIQAAMASGEQIVSRSIGPNP